MQVVHNGDWEPDPGSLSNLVNQVNSQTTVTANMLGNATIGTTDLSNVNMLYITGHYPFTLSDSERVALKDYLDRGGFLFADDCSNQLDNEGFETSFRNLVIEMYGVSLEVLPSGHAVYSSHYILDGNNFSFTSEGNGTDWNIEPLEGYSVSQCIEDESGTLDIEGTRIRTGREVRIPVRIQNAPNYVYSFGFEFTYDASKLEPIGFDRGDLVESFEAVEVNLIEPGRLIVGGYCDETAIPQGTNGYLVWLKFQIIGSQEDNCYPLQLEDLKDDIANASKTGGCFCIYGCNGDLNEDGRVTPGDALIAFRCYLRSGPCLDCSDANKDGEVTPADARCIFQKYLGKSSCLD